MHKLSIPIAQDTPPRRRRWSLLRSAAIFVLGISLAPLISEGATLCYSQWCEVMGKNVKVHTPLFDSLRDGLESGHSSFWNSISSFYRRVPWSPMIVLPIGVILMILAMSMLRL